MKMPKNKRMRQCTRTLEMPRSTKRMRQCSSTLEMPRTSRMSHCSDSTTQLMDLPIEILLNILSRLPTKSLFSLRCLCKTLCCLVDFPSLADMHSRYIATTNEDLDRPQVMLLTKSKLITLPALKYYYRRHGKTAKEDHDLNEFTFDISTSIGTGYHLKFSSYGLLCFKKSRSLGGQAILVNPIRGEVLKLPPSKFDEAPHCKYEWYGMGYDAITSTHKIVRVSGPDLHSLVTQIYVLGTGSSSWRQIPAVAPPCYLSWSCVSAHGNVHWLVNSFVDNLVEFKNWILSFDFKKEEFKWTPPPNLPDYDDRTIHLINYRGSMATVVISSNVSDKSINKIEIWVYSSMWENKWSTDIEFDTLCRKQWLTSFCFLGSRPGSVGAWEQGIFFRDDSSSFKHIFLLNCNDGGITTVQVGPSSMGDCDLIPVNIFSYTGSLISLRNCPSLIHAAAGERNVFDVGKIMRSMLPRYCTEVEGLEEFCRLKRFDGRLIDYESSPFSYFYWSKYEFSPIRRYY